MPKTYQELEAENARLVRELERAHSDTDFQRTTRMETEQAALAIKEENARLTEKERLLCADIQRLHEQERRGLEDWTNLRTENARLTGEVAKWRNAADVYAKNNERMREVQRQRLDEVLGENARLKERIAALEKPDYAAIGAACIAERTKPDAIWLCPACGNEYRYGSGHQCPSGTKV